MKGFRTDLTGLSYHLLSKVSRSGGGNTTGVRVSVPAWRGGLSSFHPLATPLVSLGCACGGATQHFLEAK